jgi:hypothetical protein
VGARGLKNNCQFDSIHGVCPTALGQEEEEWNENNQFRANRPLKNDCCISKLEYEVFQARA